MKHSAYYNKSLALLRDIGKNFPEYNLGRHLATAFDGQNMWGITDMEMFIALERYRAELEFDIPHPYTEEDISTIIYEGTHLDTILDEDD